MTKSDDIPRRVRMEQWVPAEHAIATAMEAVEAMPADVRLTDAVTLLGAARAKVADYVDGVERQDADLAKRKAVANCYLMAKREIARLRNSNTVDAISLERWQHVLRFCEESGEKSSILRDGLPTEITDGGARATPGDTP